MKKTSFKSFLVDDLLNERENLGHQAVDPDIISSKLRSLVKQTELDPQDTTAFVIEDDEGNIVKVWVRSSQASTFEKALALTLNGDQMSRSEIAEVLFELRKKFDIIDARWPTFKEDEEELPKGDSEEKDIDVDIDVDADELDGDDGETGDQDVDNDDSLDDGSLDDEPESADSSSSDPLSADPTTMLQHILQMMSADAEAKKAEAEARRAEAEAKAAEYAAMAMEKQVRDQEQLLDIEKAEKAEKDAKQQSEKLAKLAKYRYELRRGKTK